MLKNGEDFQDMKVPSEVTIFNIKYRIEQLYQVSVDDRNEDGNVIYDTQTINIKKDLPNDYKKHVFIHELIHAVFEHFKLKHDEDLIDKLAAGFIEIDRALSET